MWYAKCVNNNFSSHICTNCKTFIEFRLSRRKQEEMNKNKETMKYILTKYLNKMRALVNIVTNLASGTIKGGTFTD
jgi:hypothetical protein